MKKRCLVSVLLCAVLSVRSVFADYEIKEVTSTASNNFTEKPVGTLAVREPKQIPFEKGLSLRLFSTESPSKSIEDYLKDAFYNRVGLVDIYNAGYRYTENEMLLIMKDVTLNYDVMVYEDLYRNMNGKYVNQIEPQYILDSKKADQEAIKMMDDQIAEYLECAKDVPDIEGKMLVIHDKFCNENTYAFEAVSDVQNNLDCFTGYGVFLNHRAVCQGNVVALKAIYEALNEELKKEMGTDEDIIENVLCASFAEGVHHIWNVVKLNGKWYYIDETWDDNDTFDTGEEYVLITEENWNNKQYENSDMFSLVGHEYFLAPLSEMDDHLSKEDRTDSFDKWMYFPLNGAYKSDDKLLSNDGKYVNGYIFNGGFFSFGYDGENYTANTPNVPHTFYSKLLRSNGTLATKIYNYADSTGKTEKRIVVFENQENPAGIVLYFPTYNSKGAMESLLRAKISTMAGVLRSFTLPDSTEKVIFLQNGTIKPLAEAQGLE